MSTLTAILSSINNALKPTISFVYDEAYYSKLTQATYQLERKLWQNKEMTQHFAGMDYEPTLKALISKVNCNTKHIDPDSDYDYRVMLQIQIASSVSNIVSMLSHTETPGYSNRSVVLIPDLIQTQKKYPNYGLIGPVSYYNEERRFEPVRTKLHGLSVRIWRALMLATTSSMKKTGEYMDMLAQPETLIACYKTFVAISPLKQNNIDSDYTASTLLQSFSTILHMAGKHNAAYVRAAVDSKEFDLSVLSNYMESFAYNNADIALGCCGVCQYIARYAAHVTNTHLVRAIIKCVRHHVDIDIASAGLEAIMYSLRSMPSPDMKHAVMEYGIIELVVRKIDTITGKMADKDGFVDSIVRCSIDILLVISTSHILRQELQRHNVRSYIRRLQETSKNPKYDAWIALLTMI